MKLCDECGLRDATIHLTQISGNETQTFTLCEECAKKRGITISIDEEALKASVEVPEQSEEERKCSACGTTLSEFRVSGLLGCTGCYSSFESEIEALLLQVHGSMEHKDNESGNAAPVRNDKNDVTTLRSELEFAILNEEFERAAELRDTIHQIKNAGAK